MDRWDLVALIGVIAVMAPPWLAGLLIGFTLARAATFRVAFRS